MDTINQTITVLASYPNHIWEKVLTVQLCQNVPIAIEHCDEVSRNITPSGQPHRDPFGVEKQAYSQPPLR